jgi:hypothetical protein
MGRALNVNIDRSGRSSDVADPGSDDDDTPTDPAMVLTAAAPTSSQPTTLLAVTHQTVLALQPPSRDRRAINLESSPFPTSPSSAPPTRQPTKLDLPMDSSSASHATITFRSSREIEIP